MDTIQIVKKSFGLVLRYRALWLFGCLLALTLNNTLWLSLLSTDDDVMMENRLIFSNSFTITFPGQGLTVDFSTPGNPDVTIEGLEPNWYQELSEDSSVSDVWAVLVSIGLVVLSSIFLKTLFKYTSQAALIRMVDEYEHSEKMVRIRQGLRLGWSRVAVKLFLIDLFTILPVGTVFALLFFLAISPLFIFATISLTESIPGAIFILVMTVIGLLMLIALIIIATVILSVTRPVMHRACAINGLGIFASIRRGFHLLKICFSEVLTTWLAWLAVRLAWIIAITPVVIIFSPAIFITLMVGIFAGTLLTVLVAAIASQIVSVVFAFLIGIVFAIPLFLIITFSPVFFLSGLVAVYLSSFWTLSYRAFRPSVRDLLEPSVQPEKTKLKTALAQKI